MKSVLIFDFDGTIADTLHHLVEISNQLSSEFDFKKISPHELQGLQEKSTKEVIEHLGVPWLKIPLIITRAKKQMHHQMATIKPIEGLKEALLQLKQCGYQLGILSSNSSENVLKFLQKHNLDFFDFIKTTPKIWAKNIGLNKVIESEGLESEEIVYICDEIRDIKAAKKAGIRVAAVAWGYNTKKTLQNHDPDYFLNKPEDLITTFPDTK